MQMLRSLLLTDTPPPGAPAARYWLEAWSWIVPGFTASRFFLLADLGILLLIGTQTKVPFIATFVSVALAFIVLTSLGMLLTDFHLGLAAFHVLIVAVGLLLLKRARWAAVGAVGLLLLLGIVT
ncbi:MAG TPA: hypothetical protein VJO34_04430 [Methylomirabilota bacterium]|nr:hypothetical protein [Methylomirabilota bacterium]